MTDSERNDYLRKLDVGAEKPSLDYLKTLQFRHVISVPFENLDVIARRPILLNEKDLFEKIVVNDRGGYCFELNTLFSVLLKAFGFVAYPVLGRVRLRNPAGLTPRNHMANIVMIEERKWIADVGFGGLNSKVPLLIGNEEPVEDNDGVVRVIGKGKHEYLIQRFNKDEWQDQYSFEDIHVCQEDIDIANYYMSNAEGSHFRQYAFVGLYTADGRIGLFNNKFTERKGLKIMHEEEVESEWGWRQLLQRKFGLNMNFSSQEFERMAKVKSAYPQH